MLNPKSSHQLSAVSNQLGHCLEPISKFHFLVIGSCVVIPAQAGIQFFRSFWMPAFAGMTVFPRESDFEIGSNIWRSNGCARRVRTFRAAGCALRAISINQLDESSRRLKPAATSRSLRGWMRGGSGVTGIVSYTICPSTAGMLR
jgi:hypothetical protein